MHYTALVYKTIQGREKLGTSGQHWLADSRSLVLVIFMDLFLCHGDTATAMEIPQRLFVYTRHFVIVFGFYSVLLLPDGSRCPRAGHWSR